MTSFTSLNASGGNTVAVLVCVDGPDVWERSWNWTLRCRHSNWRRIYIDADRLADLGDPEPDSEGLAFIVDNPGTVGQAYGLGFFLMVPIFGVLLGVRLMLDQVRVS